MTVLTFPAGILGPTGAEWRLTGKTQVHESPFDGSIQTQEMPGARWEGTLTWQQLRHPDWRILDAFLNSLRGRAGHFLCPTFHAPRRGTATGNPSVNGAGQTGATLNLTGFGAAGIALATGDFLSFTDSSGKVRLHQATADVSGASVAVPITPPLRRSPNSGAIVNVAAPVCTVMLVDDTGAGVRAVPPRKGSFSITLREVLT